MIHVGGLSAPELIFYERPEHKNLGAVMLARRPEGAHRVDMIPVERAVDDVRHTHTVQSVQHSTVLQ